jgi:hypothetical protein
LPKYSSLFGKWLFFPKIGNNSDEGINFLLVLIVCGKEDYVNLTTTIDIGK